MHMQVVMKSEGSRPDLGRLYFGSAPVEPFAAIHAGWLTRRLHGSKLC